MGLHITHFNRHYQISNSPFLKVIFWFFPLPGMPVLTVPATSHGQALISLPCHRTVSGNLLVVLNFGLTRSRTRPTTVIPTISTRARKRTIEIQRESLEAGVLAAARDRSSKWGVLMEGHWCFSSPTRSKPSKEDSRGNWGPWKRGDWLPPPC